MLKIAPVHSKSQQRQFIDLPRILHANDKNWVPRIMASEKELVGFAKHPFSEQATSQAFLACSDGVPCGRIVAIDNSIHATQYPNDSIGFAGFFESTNEHAIANGLFDKASNWLRERGFSIMRGPVSPSMNYEAGLLVDGFDKPPTFMMPYNPKYYVKLWEQYGFTKSQDMFAFVGNQEIYDTADKALAIAEQAAERFGATFRQIDRKNFVSEVQTFLRLYNSASASTWGFIPFTENEIVFLANELKHLIVPDLTSFMIVDGKTVGATFGLLDYNPIVKRIRGKLLPFGFLSILFGRKAIKKSRCMSINILPEFQRWGLGLCLLNEYLKQGSKKGIRDVEFSYVLESNHLAASSLAKAGNKREKTYRVYDKQL